MSFTWHPLLQSCLVFIFLHQLVHTHTHTHVFCSHGYLTPWRLHSNPAPYHPSSFSPTSPLTLLFSPLPKSTRSFLQSFRAALLTWHFLFSDLWDGVHLLLVQKDQDGAVLSAADPLRATFSLTDGELWPCWKPLNVSLPTFQVWHKHIAALIHQRKADSSLLNCAWSHVGSCRRAFVWSSVAVALVESWTLALDAWLSSAGKKTTAVWTPLMIMHTFLFCFCADQAAAFSGSFFCFDYNLISCMQI